MRVPPIPSTRNVARALPQRQSQSQPPTRVWQDLNPHGQQQIAQVLAEMIRRLRLSSQGQEQEHGDNR